MAKHAPALPAGAIVGFGDDLRKHSKLGWLLGPN